MAPTFHAASAPAPISLPFAARHAALELQRLVLHRQFRPRSSLTVEPFEGFQGETEGPSGGDHRVKVSIIAGPHQFEFDGGTDQQSGQDAGGDDLDGGLPGRRRASRQASNRSRSSRMSRRRPFSRPRWVRTRSAPRSAARSSSSSKSSRRKRKHVLDERRLLLFGFGHSGLQKCETRPVVNIWRGLRWYEDGKSDGEACAPAGVDL